MLFPFYILRMLRINFVTRLFIICSYFIRTLT